MLTREWPGPVSFYLVNVHLTVTCGTDGPPCLYRFQAPDDAHGPPLLRPRARGRRGDTVTIAPTDLRSRVSEPGARDVPDSRPAPPAFQPSAHTRSRGTCYVTRLDPSHQANVHAASWGPTGAVLLPTQS